MTYVKPVPPPRPECTNAATWARRCDRAADEFMFKDPAYISVETVRVPRISVSHDTAEEEIGVRIGRPTLITWNLHGTKLEARFPGCQVAYDRHPTLRTWDRPYLTVSYNWLGLPPRQRGVPPERFGHRRHRRRLHEALHHSQRMGTLLLVAYERVPPTWKPNMIPTYSWRPPRGDDPGIVGTHFVPVHAIYHPEEEQWVLIR